MSTASNHQTDSGQWGLNSFPEQATRHPNSTLNPGDRVDDAMTIDEKANRPAIQLDGEHIPAYFVVEGESGERRALHHVEDAEAIADVIRQARMDDQGNRHWW